MYKIWITWVLHARGTNRMEWGKVAEGSTLSHWWHRQCRKTFAKQELQPLRFFETRVRVSNHFHEKPITIGLTRKIDLLFFMHGYNSYENNAMKKEHLPKNMNCKLCNYTFRGIGDRLVHMVLCNLEYGEDVNHTPEQVIYLFSVFEFWILFSNNYIFCRQEIQFICRCGFKADCIGLLLTDHNCTLQDRSCNWIHRLTAGFSRVWARWRKSDG